MELTEKEQEAMTILDAIKENLKKNKNLDISFLIEITDKTTGETKTYHV